MPDHAKSVLTSKYYATEKRFISLARALKRVQKLDDAEFFENPYTHRDTRTVFKSENKFEEQVREDSYPSIMHLSTSTISKKESTHTVSS